MAHNFDGQFHFNIELIINYYQFNKKYVIIYNIFFIHVYISNTYIYTTSTDEKTKEHLIQLKNKIYDKI